MVSGTIAKTKTARIIDQILAVTTRKRTNLNDVSHYDFPRGLGVEGMFKFAKFG